jgi:hypothetical protein
MNVSGWRSWLLALVVGVLGVSIGTLVHLTVLRPATASPSPPPLPFAGATGDLRAALGHQRGLRVLFLGNSLTYTNALPQMVASLANQTPGMRVPVFAVSWTQGGATLGQIDANVAVRELLRVTRWDVIIMQEATGPALASGGDPSEMISDVAKLQDQARQVGAVPMLFETWGNRTGTNPAPYLTEQATITANYRSVAQSHQLHVARVGEAWARALSSNPALALWGPDGHHPALAGSYLAAAVISDCLSHAPSPHPATIDPRNSTYTGSLRPPLARWLRQIAGANTAQNQCTER